MPPLLQRVLTAAVLIAIMIAIGYFFSSAGLIFIGFVFAIVGHLEFAKINLSPKELPKVIVLVFVSVSLALLAGCVWLQSMALPAWALGIAAYYSFCIWVTRNRIPLAKLYELLSVSTIGFVYLALFIGLGLRLLLLDDGVWWFASLVAVVSAGDVFAFFGGRWFGKRKLMPDVSPKKTIAGSVCGVGGSILTAMVMQPLFFNPPSFGFLAGLGLATAVFGQSGDLFVSLSKRVAHIKDSGHSLPGHGGILDRIDGIVFGAPAFYAAATLFSQSF